MTLTGTPPIYTRGFSFTTHSSTKPTIPQPGDKLDVEFNDISTAISAYVTSLQGITNANGTLKNGIVGEAQLAPGLFDSIVEDAEAQLQPIADAAAASRDAAATHAATAQTHAANAAADAQVAAGAIADTQAAQQQAQAHATAASQSSATATTQADRANNASMTAEGAMNAAWALRDQAFEWAEYLAGPVEPAPPGWPEAIDDGMWSAKWWAIRAREIVGAWGGFYLGAFASAPVPPASEPYPPGTLYFDTTQGQMMVWDGTTWRPLMQPGISIQDAFTYVAAADQQDFSGPDASGKTPLLDAINPRPSDVHVDGVKLVLDSGSGFGDYTIDAAASTLHIKVPLLVDSIVQWDLLLKPAEVAPGSVNAYKLHDVDRDPATNEPGEFDGLITTFPLRYTSLVDGTTKPAIPSQGVQLQIQLDGVGQEFGPDFTTSGSNIVFAQPPVAGARFWGVWYQPGSPPP